MPKLESLIQNIDRSRRNDNEAKNLHKRFGSLHFDNCLDISLDSQSRIESRE